MQRPRLPRLLTVSLIPLLALTATIALGMTPWGELYRTIVTQGAQQRAAEVRLSGMGKPAVRFEVAVGEDGAYVTVTLEEAEKAEKAAGVGLTVPAGWKLQEVRGMHAKGVGKGERGPAVAKAMAGKNGKGEKRIRELTWASVSQPVRFVFTTQEFFDVIAFSHDSPSHALVTLTIVSLPAKRTGKTVQLVESEWLFPLL